MDDFTRRRLYDRKPLTDSELRALWTACPTPEMREALWEIRRLHSRLAYITDHAARAVGGGDGSVGILQYFVRQIAEEPGVQTIIATDVRQHYRMFLLGRPGEVAPSEDDSEVTARWLEQRLSRPRPPE